MVSALIETKNMHKDELIKDDKSHYSLFILHLMVKPITSYGKSCECMVMK